MLEETEGEVELRKHFVISYQLSCFLGCYPKTYTVQGPMNCLVVLLDVEHGRHNFATLNLKDAQFSFLGMCIVLSH
jgi:hypothetical protein